MISVMNRSHHGGLDRFFTGGYTRIVLNGVGHFPHREAAVEVVQAVLSHLQIHDPSR